MKYLNDEKPKKAALNLNIPADLKAALTERAKELDVSMTKLIELYISRGLEQGNERKAATAE